MSDRRVLLDIATEKELHQHRFANCDLGKGTVREVGPRHPANCVIDMIFLEGQVKAWPEGMVKLTAGTGCYGNPPFRPGVRVRSDAEGLAVRAASWEHSDAIVMSAAAEIGVIFIARLI